jgi:translocation and assembly module TamB
VIGLFFRLLALAVLRTMAAALATVFVLILLLVLAVGSGPGTSWLLGVVAEVTDGAIRVEGAEGSLLGGLDAAQVTVRTGSVLVGASGVSIRVFWPELLRLRLRLEQASADSVTLELLIADEPSGEPLPDSITLPLGLVLDDLRVAALSVRRGELALDVAEVALAGDWIGDRLRLRRLAGSSQGVDLELSGAARLGMPFPLDVETAWSYPAESVSGSGQLAGDLDRLRVGQLIRLPDELRVTAELRSLLTAPVLELEAAWDSLERELPGIGLLRTRDGRLALDGGLQAWRLRLDAGVVADGLPAATVSLSADGDAGQAQVESLRVLALDGSLDARGSISFGEQPGGELRFIVRGMNPGAFDPAWPGRLDAVGAVSFAADGDWRLDLPELAGDLRGFPLALSGRLSQQGGVFELADGLLRVGGNELAARARWGDRLSGTFTLLAPDLGQALPGLSGELAGSGQLGGTLAAPELMIDLSGQELAWGGQRLQALTVRGGLPAAGRIEFELRAEGLASGGTALGDLRFTAAGPLAAHRLLFELSGGPVGLRLESAGSWDGARLQQQLLGGRLVDPLGGTWRLVEAPAFRFAEGRAQLDAHCWRNGGAEACLAALRVEPGLLEAGAQLRRLPLGLLGAALIPDEFGLAGTADADFTFARRAGVVEARLNWRQADTTVTYALAADEQISTAIPVLVADGVFSGGEASFSLAMASQVGLRMTLGGRIAGLDGEPEIDARLVGDLPDIGQLTALIVRFADIDELGGRASLDARLSGPLRAPEISGGLRLADGVLAVPATGILVEQVSLVLEGRGPGRLGLEGSARSGPGELLLSGDLFLAGDGALTGSIAARGQDFRVIRLPDIEVDVSPDVEVRLVDRQFRATGRLFVPLGQVRLREIPPDAPRPSPDAIIHGEEGVNGEASGGIFVLERLEVELGPRVSLRGFGLDTGLAGRLVLAQPQNGRTIGADGIVTLERGSFSALGKQLNIDRGALIFSGLIDDPGLDVRTSRRVTYQGSEVTVGLLLSGTLRQIQTRIFSEPAMSEIDALSYLTLDRPFSAAGAGEGVDLTGAALSLGLRQALPVAQRLGSALSLDEVGLEGGELEETEVIAGKQIGSSLYVRYAYGLFNRIGTIKLVYRLSRRISIEASSGEYQSMDLIYSVEW